MAGAVPAGAVDGAPTPIQRAPWVPAAGHGVAALGSTSFVSGTVYDDDGVGAVGSLVGLRSETVQLDVIIGLGPHLSFSGSLPVVMATAIHTLADGQHAAQVVSGFGDADLGLAYALLPDGPLHLTLRGDVKLPLYQGLPSVQGRQADAGLIGVPGPLPALGDGQVDVTVAAVVGARFPFGGFFAWENGYRFRTGGITDGVTGAGTFAVDALDGRLQPRWNHAFLFSMDPARDRLGVTTEFVGRSVVTTGPSCVVALPELSRGLALEVGAAFRFRGRNAAGGLNLFFVVSHVF